MPSTGPEKDGASACLKNKPIEKSEDIRIKNVTEINEVANANGVNSEDIPNGSGKRKLPLWMVTANSSISDGGTQTKRTKTGEERSFDDETPNETIASGSTTQQIEVAIKTEQSGNEDLQSSVQNDVPVSSNITTDDTAGDSNTNKANVKTENEDAPSTSTGVCKNVDFKPAVKVEKADANSTSRESCRFGIRCYRRNPMHRIEEAHPGDSDYKRPHYPPPPDGVPDCPYGNSCYRRNPTHFQQYKHPDDTDFEQNYRNYRLRQRKQRQQQNNSNNNDDFSDLDDYDLDDPFINDDSDLDYVPSEGEDYTEELDYDDCDKAEE